MEPREFILKTFTEVPPAQDPTFILFLAWASLLQAMICVEVVGYLLSGRTRSIVTDFPERAPKIRFIAQFLVTVFLWVALSLMVEQEKQIEFDSIYVILIFSALFFQSLVFIEGTFTLIRGKSMIADPTKVNYLRLYSQFVVTGLLLGAVITLGLK